MPASGARSRPVLCLGEAAVEFTGRPAGRPLGQAREWAPSPGGTVAAVAQKAARAGTVTQLAGAVGDDRWGDWVRTELQGAGVDVSRLRTLTGLPTQLVFVGPGADGELVHRGLYDLGETIDAAIGDELEELVEAAGALLIGTDSLAGPRERALTMWARERARALERPIVFDTTLRRTHWSSRADAAASANACVPGALLVVLEQAEAELLTGEADPERAALALRKAGARLVAIRRRDGGALLRGAERAQVPPPPGDVSRRPGAGPAFTGTLVHRLVASRFYPPAVAAALPEAVAAAAQGLEPATAG